MDDEEFLKKWFLDGAHSEIGKEILILSGVEYEIQKRIFINTESYKFESPFGHKYEIYIHKKNHHINLSDSFSHTRWFGHVGFGVTYAESVIVFSDIKFANAYNRMIWGRFGKSQGNLYVVGGERFYEDDMFPHDTGITDDMKISGKLSKLF